VTCGTDSSGDAKTAARGRRLHDSVSQILADTGTDTLRVEPVVCLANCERGCSAILSAPGKWAYMVGHLGPEHAADLVAYARAYAASERGIVLRAGRPASMRDVILGRFPAEISDLTWTAAARKEAAE
jgi:predicted metal-binding protein